MPKVSVLLTTYNRPDMLEEAINSVLQQTYEDWELIILDDNSDNIDQLGLLTEYWTHPKIRIYKDDVKDSERREKTRYAVLANIGLNLARGKYVTYLCDDDLFLPRRLELMTDMLDNSGNNCQVVYGAQRCENHPDMGTFYRYAHRVLDDAYEKVDHSSVMHTLEAGHAAGGWDDRPEIWRNADAHFWRRLNTAGYRFYPIPEECDVHRFHRNSVSEKGGF